MKPLGTLSGWGFETGAPPRIYSPRRTPPLKKRRSPSSTTLSALHDGEAQLGLCCAYRAWRQAHPIDTGNNPDILARNAKAKGVDLSKLDFVVMSRRHGDHMGGLDYLLSVILPRAQGELRRVRVLLAGAASTGRTSLCRWSSAIMTCTPPPEVMKFGSAWPKANFELIEKTTEIASGIHLIALVSDKPTTLTSRSIARDRHPYVPVVGLVFHPGIDKIVEAAVSINKRIHIIAGGFHLVLPKIRTSKRSSRNCATPGRWTMWRPDTARESPRSPR